MLCNAKMTATKLLFPLALVIFFSQALASVEKRSTVCYESLGCFSNTGAFAKKLRALLSTTPNSPSTMRTYFQLYTRDNLGKAIILDARTPDMAKVTWSTFKNRPTKLIVHGFIDSPTLTHWMGDAKDELLKNGDNNVIIVDWSRSNKPPYTQATANTRVVGAQTAELIKSLKKDFNMSASSFHIIGHSLGAHISGYAGEKIPGLARITGLDPAGPYFEGMDKVVRLDATDAEYVDIVHTDADSILRRGMGTRDTSGEADFFPNKGNQQPGCQRTPLKKIFDAGIKDGIADIISCDHLRSLKYFVESINSKCSFTGYPCASQEDFDNGRCHWCPKGGCPSMGYHSDVNKPSKDTKYYLTTGSKAPFCQPHTDLRIQFARVFGARKERGTLRIRVVSTSGYSDSIPLTPSPVMYGIGAAAEYHVDMPADVGQISAVQFSWTHRRSLTDPSSWNPLGLRHPKLYVHEIIIKRLGSEMVFCGHDAGVETGKLKFMFKSSKKC